MKEFKLMTVQEYLETKGELTQGQTCYLNNPKTKSYWPLGTWKNGKIWSGSISMTLEPEKTFVKV